MDNIEIKILDNKHINIFNKELENEETYYKKQGVLNVNDEAIMFDVIIEELSKKYKLYAKVR